MIAKAYGGVVVREDGRILLREPRNHFDGYVWTFPKGRSNQGEKPEDAAIREAHEETGVKAKILRAIPGEFEGGTTVNRYFLMAPVEVTNKWDWETASVRWATPEEAAQLIRETKNQMGQQRDLAVLAAAVKLLGHD